MKSFAVSFVGSTLVLVLCAFAFVAYAQTSATTQAEREAVLQERTQQQASDTDQRQEVSAERRAAFSAAVETRVVARLEGAKNQLDASVSRMRNIIGRIETRIEALAISGTDTTEIETHLADAKGALLKAEGAMGNVELGIADLLESGNPRGTWTIVKELFFEVKGYLIEAHQALRETVAALKAASGTDES